MLVICVLLAVSSLQWRESFMTIFARIAQSGAASGRLSSVSMIDEASFESTGSDKTPEGPKNKAPQDGEGSPRFLVEQSILSHRHGGSRQQVSTAVTLRVRCVQCRRLPSAEKALSR